MFELPPLLQKISQNNRASYLDADINHGYRAKLKPYKYVARDFSKADKKVNSVVDQISKHIKSSGQNKVLFVFDLDGTLTKTSNPDITLATQIPENISRALTKLAENPQIEIAIVTARNHHALNQMNLSDQIKKYASNGTLRIDRHGDDKIHMNIKEESKYLFDEAENIKQSISSNPKLQKYFKQGDIATLAGVGNLAIGMRQDIDPLKRAPLLELLKQEMDKSIPNSWRQFSEYANDFTLFYCSKDVYGKKAGDKTDYQWKAPGINRVCEDLAQEDFHPTMVVCAGDSMPDLTMMDEACSWNEHHNLIENINIAVGKRIPNNSTSVTHRFKDADDIYEMLLHLAA